MDPSILASDMDTVVLMLAAGRGERLGGMTPKAFVPLMGIPLLVRSIRTFLAVKEVNLIQPVLAEADFALYESLDLPHDARLAAPIPGGALRQDSVAAGLAAVPEEVEWVLVHDAARCLVTPEDVERVRLAARAHEAAILAAPARDTIKMVDNGVVAETPDRDGCWAAQTPQVFRRELLARALEKAHGEGFVGTDDSQLVERLGTPVQIVEGPWQNIKITVPGDLVLAEAILKEGKQGKP